MRLWFYNRTDFELQVFSIVWVIGLISFLVVRITDLTVLHFLEMFLI